AACNLSPRAASKQMRIAQALRDRLPRTAAVFATGVVSMSVIDAITWRTHLVDDADALGLIDAAIAAEAGAYGAHSEKALIGAVDLWVEKFDPDAVVRSRRAAKDLYVEFDDKDDP
ncbi:13E12 repeat family protein, partial [Mycobacterium sp. MBM]|nr:13E12 repeat family protein [Mycobacterium sp. MBM]